ncbi:pimeloyl-ACP methyl ester carboxylesterase [Salirhabdus euzebyi]|uniref:Pimeloyl-ACP methyl ester carboxylesterase n=1 Tax=Salirhabdus euzebyi TaxID=394506 RepID=A0A841Q5Z6_9BACI|nr:alpha/beta hydrolase [Salirhabdus euzebyi]MBB6453783.1 pimeloyl-ACP methyl ester carboxylesterase [Salirhabdus euzebyi]
MECLVKTGIIHYESYGQGKNIIILHAMGTDHRSMKGWLEPVFEKVAGWRRLYIDLPAHGKTIINDQLRTTEDMVQSLLAFIEKVIPNERFSLIGMSFGGYIAQGIVDQKSELVNGICLIAPAIHKKDRVLPEKVVLSRDDDVLSTLNPDIRAAFELLTVHQTKENLSVFLSEVQPGRQLANRQFLLSNWRDKGYFLNNETFSQIDSLDLPGLFILGRKDSVCGFMDHLSLLEKFPNASYVILDDCGHLIPIEKRKVVQALLEDWLIKISV